MALVTVAGEIVQVRDVLRYGEDIEDPLGVVVHQHNGESPGGRHPAHDRPHIVGEESDLREEHGRAVLLGVVEAGALACPEAADEVADEHRSARVLCLGDILDSLVLQGPQQSRRHHDVLA